MASSSSSSSSSSVGSCDMFSSMPFDSFTISTPPSTPTPPQQKSPCPGPDQAVFSFPHQDHTKTLLVRCLGPDVCPKYIRNLFLPYGSIKSLRIIWEQDVDTIAAVEFEEQRSAEKAMSEIDKITKKNWKDRYGNGNAKTRKVKKGKAKGFTVFVGCTGDLTEEDLSKAFQPFGRIRRVLLKRDERTGRSQRFGFVTYADESSAKMAIEEMNGAKVKDTTIRVEWDRGKKSKKTKVDLEKEEERQREYDKISKETSLVNTTIFVGYKPGILTSQLMRDKFSPYGKITGLKCYKEEGYGFIRFQERSSAIRAIQEKNGVKTKSGTVVKVGWGKRNLQY